MSESGSGGPITPEAAKVLTEAIRSVAEKKRKEMGLVDVTDSAEEVRVTSSTGGQKGAKLAAFDQIPARALMQVAELYGKGARKYSPHNFRKGHDWSLSFSALQRHAWAFWAGEDMDPENGSAHMAAVAFHALALLTFMDEQRDFDDRPGARND